MFCMMSSLRRFSFTSAGNLKDLPLAIGACLRTLPALMDRMASSGTFTWLIT